MDRRSFIKKAGRWCRWYRLLATALAAPAIAQGTNRNGDRVHLAA